MKSLWFYKNLDAFWFGLLSNFDISTFLYILIYLFMLFSIANWFYKSFTNYFWFSAFGVSIISFSSTILFKSIFKNCLGSFISLSKVFSWFSFLHFIFSCFFCITYFFFSIYILFIIFYALSIFLVWISLLNGNYWF